MQLSNNTHKLALVVFCIFVCIAFNACGDPLANQVTISTDPTNPEVVKIDLPEDDDGFEGATAPWFVLDYVIENRSDETFVLSRMEVSSNRVGDDTATSTTSIDVSSLEDDEAYDDYPLAIAVVDPDSKWQSSVNAGAVVNSVRSGLIWYISGLPTIDGQSTEQQTTLYEVNVLAFGYFLGEDADDDDVTVYERSFKIFTE